MATMMAGGNATEMAAAMVDGDRNGSGQWQWQWQWAIVTATVTATAMAMELATATEMAMAMAIAMATTRATITKEGLPLYVAAMCSGFGGATPYLHPHDTKESACVMGVTLLKVFAPLQGGGFLTAHRGLFLFIFYNYCSVY